MEQNLEWMDEYVDSVPTGQKLYKFICFFLGRKKKKLTYKEIFLIISELNRTRMGLEEAKKYALTYILNTYKYLNNKLPEGMYFEYE